jgi:hypothetical protein
VSARFVFKKNVVVVQQCHGFNLADLRPAAESRLGSAVCR